MQSPDLLNGYESLCVVGITAAHLWSSLCRLDFLTALNYYHRTFLCHANVYLMTSDEVSVVHYNGKVPFFMLPKDRSTFHYKHYT